MNFTARNIATMTASPSDNKSTTVNVFERDLRFISTLPGGKLCGSFQAEEWCLNFRAMMPPWTQ
jgi:hypothetical protein